MTNLGRLDLLVAGRPGVAYSGAPGRPLGRRRHRARWPTPRCVELATRYGARVHEKFGRVVGTLAADLRRGRGETNIGDFMADALRGQAQADVALINAGGIRKNVPAGPVTALDVLEVLPFGNALVTVEPHRRPGAPASSRPTPIRPWAAHHGILQVSGLTYVYRQAAAREPGAEVVEVTVGGKPLAPERVYTRGDARLRRPDDRRLPGRRAGRGRRTRADPGRGGDRRIHAPGHRRRGQSRAASCASDTSDTQRRPRAAGRGADHGPRHRLRDHRRRHAGRRHHPGPRRGGAGRGRRHALHGRGDPHGHRRRRRAVRRA